MERFKLDELVKWKQKKNKKPLIIRGARQVGKTWLMKKFGEIYYENTIYINFDNNIQIKNLFEQDMDITRIVLGLEIYSFLSKSLVTNSKYSPSPSSLIS